MHDLPGKCNLCPEWHSAKKKMEAVKRLNGKKVLLTYAGSHVFQLFSRIHLSNKWSDVGRQVQAGVSAFLHLIWCIFCSHLIELPNLFFKQQCSTKNHDIKQLNMSLKVCILYSPSFLCNREWAQGPKNFWFSYVKAGFLGWYPKYSIYRKIKQNSS